MATADELLTTTVEKTLTADLNTRIISIPSSIRTLGVEADDDVHRLQFKVPRYFGEFDLSEFKTCVNYENAKRGGDVYPVDDVTITDDDSITFSWLVDRFAFKSAGDVKFSICMKKYDGEEVVKEFNTTPATLPVLPGLETGKAAIESNPGLLDTVLMRLYAVEAANGIGQNGYYNVIKVTENSAGVVFTIVDQDGNTTAIVKHGIDGEDGHTPVKGVDYFTPDEQTEIETTISAQAKEYINNWAPKYVTLTLASASWTDNTQTITIAGVTADNPVFVGPEPSNANYEAYNDAEVRCVSQAESALTFQCGSTPSTDLLVNVAIYYSADDVASAGDLTVTDDGKGNVTIM